MNDCKFEDVRNLTMAVAAVDGNMDNNKNDSDNNNDRPTSSALISL